MSRLILNEEDDLFLYKDKKTGKIYYYDGQRLVEINSSDIAKAEENKRKKGDVTGETEESRNTRIANANAKLSDENIVSSGVSIARAANFRSRQNALKKQQEKERKEKEKSFYAQYPAGTREIQLSLQDFIKDQLKQRFGYSYSKFNKKYNNASGQVIKPGRYKEEQKNIPTINVYFDQSGSWDSSDIENGNNIISVLGDYQKKKLLKVNVKYFADRVTNTPPGGGGTDARPVMNDIIATKPDNVIIMTDSDTTSQSLPTAVVPGGVWFIWKNGLKSEALRDSLRGAKLTKEFNLG